MLFDKHREGRNEHRVELAGNTLGKTVVVRSNHAQLFVLDPLLEGYNVFGHIPYFFDGSAAFNLEGVENILSLGTDGSLIVDVIGNGPHLLPIELLGINKHTMVEVGLVDVEVHHARIRTTDLGNVRIAETTTHLCRTAPVLDFCLCARITAFHYARDDGRTFACTIQVGNHFAGGTASIQLAQPGWDVGFGIIRSLFLLEVHDDDRNVQVANSRQHIVRGAIGEHLQNHEIDVSCAELIAGSHRLLLGGHHTAINDLDRIGKRFLECGILAFELWYKLGELWEICSEGNREHTYPCFGFN